MLTRRTVLTALGIGALSVAGLGYVREFMEAPSTGPGMRLTTGGCMGGVGMPEMSVYMEMFMRHREISRTVEDIPGGVRTITESNSPDLAAQLRAHVSGMYSHLDQGIEVTCMSQSLPILFRRADGYRRQLTITPTGVIAEETSDDPALTDTIRAHAREVTGFVNDGMPAMMQPMMGCGGMMGPGMRGGRNPGGMGPH